MSVLSKICYMTAEMFMELGQFVENVLSIPERLAMLETKIQALATSAVLPDVTVSSQTPVVEPITPVAEAAPSTEITPPEAEPHPKRQYTRRAKAEVATKVPTTEPPATAQRPLRDGEGDHIRARLTEWRDLSEEERKAKIYQLASEMGLSLQQIHSAGAWLSGRLRTRHTVARGNRTNGRKKSRQRAVS